MRFTGILEDRNIRISMDGRGRVFDNIFVERLWRSVKYEEVYLKDYQTLAEAYRGLVGYFEFYNTERLHQAFTVRLKRLTSQGLASITLRMLNTILFQHEFCLGMGESLRIHLYS